MAKQKGIIKLDGTIGDSLRERDSHLYLNLDISVTVLYIS